MRPERLEPPLAFVAALDEPEQEEQADVGLPKRMTLVVQEHVTVVRCWERGEAGELRLHGLDIQVGEIGCNGRGQIE